MLKKEKEILKRAKDGEETKGNKNVTTKYWAKPSRECFKSYYLNSPGYCPAENGYGGQWLEGLLDTGNRKISMRPYLVRNVSRMGFAM